MTKICCIEDDYGVRELILCAMAHSGFEAVGFKDAQSFYEAQPDFDLLILDIMLPDEDGITILKKLRKKAEYSDKPVIMLTAKSTEYDKVSGLDAGADDYMTKPFGVMELISRINAVLRRCPDGNRDVLSIGELKLNDSARKLTYAGNDVAVTAKEFKTLWYLMKRRGSVVTRDELMNGVWGYEYEGATRTVDMHIKTLRQKLEAAGCSGIIKTVRGVGYTIE